MSTAKLVKNFILISFLLLSVKIFQIKGVRAESSEEESDAPAAGRIVYDQRQTGKYNIHVVIKDVAIIEMDQNEIADQNYSDEEYYYDEDDLTVKPITIKSTTTTSKPIIEDTTTTTTTIKPSISTTQTTPDTSTTNHILLNINITESTKQPNITTTVKTPTTTPEDIKIHELNSYSTSYLPAVDIKSRSKVEPIYAIEEPILQTKHHLKDFNYGLPSNKVQSREGSYSMNSGDGKKFKNSRIYKVKVHRSQILPQAVRCRTNQYRDTRGNCRRRRDSSSGSILKRLFKMLITLPFRQNDQQQSDDYSK